MKRSDRESNRYNQPQTGQQSTLSVRIGRCYQAGRSCQIQREGKLLRPKQTMMAIQKCVDGRRWCQLNVGRCRLLEILQIY